MFTLFLLLLSWSTTTQKVDAYRVGDAVDAAIQFDTSSSSPMAFTFGLAASSSSSDATALGPTTTLRSQMPKFGISSKVEFRRDNNDGDVPSTSRTSSNSNKKKKDLIKNKAVTSNGFTLYFEDGLRTVEYVPFKNYQGLQLQKLVITFVYSKSGTGMIHSVLLTEKAYSKYNYQPDTFQVEYQWKEEAPVRLLAGYAVLFFMVFVTSILFLMQTCLTEDPTMMMDDDGGGNSNTTNTKNVRKTQAYGGYSKER
ncbi:hypothetical protein ACA910_015954 [Epithemia clementina (nom. ined.)]